MVMSSWNLQWKCTLVENGCGRKGCVMDFALQKPFTTLYLSKLIKRGSAHVERAGKLLLIY